MRTWMKALAATVLIAASSAANARMLQTPSDDDKQCKNVGTVDSVYQTGLGGNKYEYHVQVRNSKDHPIKVTLNFGSFPSNVSLFSASLKDVVVEKYSTKTIKFGNGTNGKISSPDVVKIYTDAAMSLPNAYVLIKNCHK